MKWLIPLVRLNRNLRNHFGDPKYAKEELVAELSSAMVGNTMGFDRRIQDNNVAYIDGWLKALHEEPKFIVSVMADVNKASNMILEKVDAQKIALGESPILGTKYVEPPDLTQGKHKTQTVASSKTEKQGEEKKAITANVYKLSTGSYVIQASVNGQNLDQKPIDNKTAVTYLRLSDDSQKATMLSSIVKDKYGDELQHPKAERQVSTGLKL
jgi:hypothetical protein